MSGSGIFIVSLSLILTFEGFLETWKSFERSALSMHPRPCELEISSLVWLVVSGKECLYKRQGRMQGKKGAFVCTLGRENRKNEQVNQRERRLEDMCARRTEEERLEHLGRMRRPLWASGVCWHENFRERCASNATTPVLSSIRFQYCGSARLHKLWIFHHNENESPLICTYIYTFSWGIMIQSRKLLRKW